MPDATGSDDPEHRLSPAQRSTRRYVLCIVMPMWIASGAIDYVLHRRVHIERNAGTYESRLHVAGIALTSLPVLAGLLLEINAGVLLAMSVGFVAHIGMTVWDVAYADDRRTIVPLEQHVHAMLELLPFTALSLVFCAYPGQATALIGRGAERPDFSLKRKRIALPRRQLIATIAAFGVFVALPFAEEFVRCRRYERDARRTQDVAPAAAAEAGEPNAPGSLR